jgi:hypothetical protein
VQRSVGRLQLGAWQPRDGDQQGVEQACLGRAPEDVQAIADLHFLEVAQMGIEQAQHGIRIVAGRNSEIVAEAKRRGGGQDVGRERPRAGRIEIGGQRVLVDELLEAGEVAVQFGPRQRRRQVVDDHGGRAALGLHAFARIVDDEGIDVRQGPKDRLREARVGQADRLAGQPFEVAVLADMHDRVGAKGDPQPKVEGQVVVRRRQIRCVIGCLRIDVVAAGRLDPQRDVAEDMGPEAKDATLDVWILFRLAPARLDGLAGRGRQLAESGAIGRYRPGGPAYPARPPVEVVRGSGRQKRHQARRIRRDSVETVSRAAERGEQGDATLGRVEPDAVRQAPVAVGVVGNNQGNPSVGRPCAAQPHPAGGEIGRRLDPVGSGPAHDGSEAGSGIARLLERDRVGEDATVDFRHHDVHRQIAGREASGRVPPRHLARSCERDLKDRAVRRRRHGPAVC